jgi:signal transduction histidine kinase
MALLVLDASVAEYLLPTLSHDLRNPLNSMQLAIELLARLAPAGSDDAARDKLAKLATMFRNEVKRLTDTIEHLPDYLPSSDSLATIEPFDLRVVLKQATAALSHSMRAREIQFETDASDGSVWVRAVPTHIRTVLIALISSIIKQLQSRAQLALRVDFQGSNACVRVEHAIDALQIDLGLARIQRRHEALRRALASVLENQHASLAVSDQGEQRTHSLQLPMI